MKTKSAVLIAALVAVPAFAGHRFACVDNGANRLVLVDQAEPSRGWSVAIPAGSRDLQRLAGGRLLVSHGNGCGIYDMKDGRCLWRLEGFSGVQTARHIADRDEIMLGAIAKGAVEFHFLKRDGEWFQKAGRVVRVTGVEPGLLRLARFTSDGHVLFTTGNPIRVVEWDLYANRRSARAVSRQGLPAVRRADGLTAVSTGGAVSVVEIARDGTIVKTWLATPIARSSARGGVPDSSSSETAISWSPTGWPRRAGKGPHVIEVDADNKVVWSWEDHAAAKQVTNLLMLDEK